MSQQARAVPAPAIDCPPARNPVPAETLIAPVPPAIASDLTPSVPGYEVVRKLDEGGMGIVYLAMQTALKRPVALKMVLGGGHAGTAARERFLAEAEVVARLRHPNIVQVYDFGTHTGLPWFSMEFLEGGSLAARIENGPADPSEAAALVALLADAMQAAHAGGVIHRDLKPANVLFAADGTPKITDFGLAKQGEGSGRTGTDAVMGTPAYMAPEQAAGRTAQVGPAADIYALGVMLYELLTGRVPLLGTNPALTILLVQTQEPVPVRQLAPACPRDLETVCHKCLQKDPARRYPSAVELADDLRRFLEHRPVHARPVSTAEHAWRWCRRNPTLAGLWAVSAVAALLIVGLGFWFSARLGELRGLAGVARAEAEAEKTRADAEKARADAQRFFGLLNRIRERAAQRSPGWTWANLDDLRAAAELPDARELLPELRSQAALALGSPDLRPVAGLARDIPAYCVAWHPDGRQLAFGEKAIGWFSCGVSLVTLDRPDEVRRLAFTSWPVRQDNKTVPELVHVVAFSPDGRWLVAGTRGGLLQRFDLTQPEPKAVGWTAHPHGVHRLAFSPDGAALYSRDNSTVKRWSCSDWKETAAYEAGAGADLTVAPADGTLAITGSQGLTFVDGLTLRPIRQSARMGGGIPKFLPDGKGILREANGGLVVYSTRNLDAVQTFSRPDEGDSSYSDIAVAAGGDLVVGTPSGLGRALVWERSGGRLVAELTIGYGSAKLAFSPDGSHLVVTGDQKSLLHEVRRPAAVPTALGMRAIETFAFSTDGHRLIRSAYDLPHRAGLSEWRADADGAYQLSAAVPTMSNRVGLARSVAVHGQGLAASFAGWQPLGGPGGDEVLVCDHGRVRIEPAKKDYVHLVAAPDGRYWGAVADEVRVWHADGRSAGAWKNDGGEVVSGRAGITAVAAHRGRVVAAGRDGTLRLFDLSATVRPTLTLPVTPEALRSVVLLDADTVATSTDTGRLLLVRLPEGDKLTESQISEDRIDHLAAGPGGLLAAGGADGRVRLYHRDGADLRELFTLRPNRPVAGLAFVPGGTRLAILAKGDRAVRVWDLGALRETLGSSLNAGLDSLAFDGAMPAVPLPPPVPETPAGTGGLRAEYFAAFAKTPAVVRRDAGVDFNWGEAGPAPGEFPVGEPFQVRWTGRVRAPKPGPYRLRFDSTGHVRIWIDGRIVMDRGPDEQGFESRLDLSDRPHSLWVELSHPAGFSVARLLWATADADKLQPIPGDALSPESEVLRSDSR